MTENETKESVPDFERNVSDAHKKKILTRAKIKKIFAELGIKDDE